MLNPAYTPDDAQQDHARAVVREKARRSAEINSELLAALRECVTYLDVGSFPALLAVAARARAAIAKAEAVEGAPWTNEGDDLEPCPTCQNVTYAGERCHHPVGSL